MHEVELKTLNGSLILSPGDKFRCNDTDQGGKLYQFLGIDDGFGMNEVYLMNCTDSSFCNVNESWFADRCVVKQTP